MIAYHVDRSNSLYEGQIITLNKFENIDSFILRKMFPEGISYHGTHYLDESVQNKDGNQPSFYILEYELELIRSAYFPNLISRYQAFFALEKLNDIKEWYGILNEDCTIWEIEFDENNYIKRDSNLLIPPLSFNDNQCTFSPNESFRYGYAYWQGLNCENPRYELLIKPPIRIIKKVTLR